MTLDGERHPTHLATRAARDEALERLSESFARDEISLDDFERRVDAAYASSSPSELRSLVADLPAASARELARVPAAPLARAGAASDHQPRLALAVFGNLERRVRGGLVSGAAVTAVFGNVELDLRDVSLPSGVTELHIRAVFGNVELTVPPSLAVECRGAPIFGSFASLDRLPREPSDQAVLRIIGSAVFGNVEIKTLPPRELLEAGVGPRRLRASTED